MLPVAEDNCKRNGIVSENAEGRRSPTLRQAQSEMFEEIFQFEVINETLPPPPPPTHIQGRFIKQARIYLVGRHESLQELFVAILSILPSNQK